MTTTAFVDAVTLSAASWFNDTDGVTYAGLTSVAGTANAITAVGPASTTAYAARQRWILIPGSTNSGATAITVTCNSVSLGSRNIFSGGAACVGGELVSGVPAVLVDDGTRLHIVGSILKTGALDISASTLGQIKFPATQNASANANTLDDYAEGTWVPTDGSGAALSFSTVNAYYTKIGRQVTVNGTLTYPSTGSASPAVLASLPFTIASGTGNTPVGGAWSSSAATAPQVIYGGSGSATAGFKLNNGTDVTNANLSGAIVRFSLTYNV